MSLRKLGSRLQGHPNMGIPGVEAPAGSEGIGLSLGVGTALAAKLDKKHYRTYVLMGDGEQQEGEVWEAAMTASKYRLDNLTAIVDRNGIQQDGLTEQIMPLEPLAAKWRAFNWNVIEVDGYDYLQLIDALTLAGTVRNRPTVIIAHTVKGKGISFMEWSPLYHGTPPTKDKMPDLLTRARVKGFEEDTNRAFNPRRGTWGTCAKAAEIASRGGADQLHIDVIDGHFAPNITFGPGTVKALRKVSRPEVRHPPHDRRARSLTSRSSLTQVQTC